MWWRIPEHSKNLMLIFFCWAKQIVMKINCVLLSRQDIGQALLMPSSKGHCLYYEMSEISSLPRLCLQIDARWIVLLQNLQHKNLSPSPALVKQLGLKDKLRLSRGLSMEILCPHEYDIPLIRGGHLEGPHVFRFLLCTFVSELWPQMWGTSIQGKMNNWNP